MKWLLVTIVAVTAAQPAKAKDMERLGTLLMPTYIAMSVAGVCSGETGWTFEQPHGPRGHAVHYAQHAKEETIAGLSDEQARAVLRAAAGKARDEVRRQLRTYVYPGDRAGEASRFREWCFRSVRDFIGTVISEHDRDHASFERAIADAKRDGGS